MIVLFLIMLLVIISFIIITFILTKPAHCPKEKKALFQYYNFAHRGLHTKDKLIPENSLIAFSNAIKHGYGIELDIQLTKDKKVVVFHDDTLNRIFKIQRRVDSFTYKELGQLNLYQTKEHIPLLSEVLSLVNKKVPLLIELKNSNNNELLCQLTLELLKKYQGPFCIQSFHPFIVAWFSKNAPDVLRGQLISPFTELLKDIPIWQAFLLSRLYFNYKAKPHFISYKNGTKPLTVKLCILRGAMSFVWTIRSKDISKKLECNHDGVIFEYYMPRARYGLKNKVISM